MVLHRSPGGQKGIWLLLAAAVDRRIGKIWLDQTPHSLRAALENSMNTDLFDGVIPGFALRWVPPNDLVTAMGNQRVLWTDPASWMGARYHSVRRFGIAM